MALSAEPGRTSPYSGDIGWRIVWQKIGMGFSFRRIATNLQISVGTAHRIFNRFVVTGDVSPKKRPARPDLRRLDDTHELYILALIAEYPGIIYLSEKRSTKLPMYVPLHLLCVESYNYSNCFTRKNIVYVAKQRSTELRAAFMANALQYNSNMFVWIDESGTDRRDQARKFGYAIKGRPPVYQRWLVRGKRVYCSDV